MLNKPITLLRTLFRWLCPRWAGLYVVKRSEDEPDQIERRTVHLIGSVGNEWAAMFTCPCGCNQVVRLNLLKHGDRPVWKVQADSRGRATLTPSVWRHVGCNSHFIMRHGGIECF